MENEGGGSLCTIDAGVAARCMRASPQVRSPGSHGGAGTAPRDWMMRDRSLSLDRSVRSLSVSLSHRLAEALTPRGGGDGGGPLSVPVPQSRHAFPGGLPYRPRRDWAPDSGDGATEEADSESDADEGQLFRAVLAAGDVDALATPNLMHTGSQRSVWTGACECVELGVT